MLGLLLWWGGRVRLRDLRQRPGGTLLPPNSGGVLARTLAQRQDPLVAAPVGLVAELHRFDTQHAQPPRLGELMVVGLRERRTHNSWLHNHPTLSRAQENLLRIHPDDAATRQLSSGDVAVVTGPGGTVRLRVRLSDRMMPGVVAIPHGWGHAGSRVDRVRPLGGANINTVLGGGADHMEPASGQAIMTGQRVTVVRCTTPIPSADHAAGQRSQPATAVDQIVRE